MTISAADKNTTAKIVQQDSMSTRQATLNASIVRPEDMSMLRRATTTPTVLHATQGAMAHQAVNGVSALATVARADTPLS